MEKTKGIGTNRASVSKLKYPARVRGLNGIMSLFKVSKAKAYKMYHNELKDACTKTGNIILVDTKKAFELVGYPTDNVNFLSED